MEPASPIEERSKMTVGLIDTYARFLCPGEHTYNFLRIPKWLPPECIVIFGFFCATSAAIAFSWSTQIWWAGLVAAAFVYGNFVSDYMDGRHARATNQCRNGGEILDHFFDPLSFCVISTGIGVSCNRLDLAIATIIGIYGNASIVFQEAMIMRRLEMKFIGPNEARVLYMILGSSFSIISGLANAESVARAGEIFLWIASCIGLGQMSMELLRTIWRVNALGPPPDATPWNRPTAKLNHSKSS